MGHKEVIVGVVTAVATAAILGVIGWVGGVFSKGQDAVDRAVIQAIVHEVMVTASGKPVKERIAEVDSQLAVLETRTGRLEKDIDDAEQAILCLAGGC